MVLLFRNPSGDGELVGLQYRQTSSLFVEMLADYVSTRYGGIHVYWKVLTSDVSHWRGIDEEIWRLLGNWNLLSNARLEKEPERGG